MSQRPFGVITLFSFKERFDPATQEHGKLFSARMFLCPGLSLYEFLSLAELLQDSVGAWLGLMPYDWHVYE